MKVSITYPPLKSKKGTPLLSQNRQFQWSISPPFIYPLVPASAATLLKTNNYQVQWLDGIAEKLSFSQWLIKLKKFNPDLIFIESKTPVIKKHWQIIRVIKKELPNSKVVLAGDHVTALPQESLKHSPVDFILTGGDYDTLLLNLANHLSKGDKLSPGFYYQKRGKIVSTGQFTLKNNLNTLPLIDRQLTKWRLYAFNNGNYKYTPGSYIMSSRDCWWRNKGGCTFCSWTTLFPKFRTRSVNNVLDEIGQLIDLGVKEIFDDAGTLMAGKWLEGLCAGIIKKGYHKKVKFGCNLRFGVLTQKQYKLLSRAGFRLLLFGLESASQKTLNMLNKGTKINKIERELEIIQKASHTTNGNLQPHITCMIGYPWESLQDAKKTVQFTNHLFKKGLIDSLQATIIIPYPGTALFKQCQKNKWLLTTNWSQYDMKEPVMKTPLSKKEIHKLTRKVYTSALTPKFIIKKVLSVRSAKDFIHNLKSAIKLLTRTLDFK